MTPFTKFTTAQWCAIQAARADWPAGIDWEAVRLELEQAGREYRFMRANRRRRPPKAERARLQRMLKYARGLNRELVELAPGGKRALAVIERALDSWLIRNEIWNSRHFGRRADAHRELLYWRVIQQWTGPLRGELGFSRAGGVAGGPMVRYLVAILAAVLGDEAPGRAGIAKIIVKERKRRRLAAAKLKRWKMKKERQSRNNYTLNAGNIFKV
jgi:hypothetical protein